MRSRGQDDQYGNVERAVYALGVANRPAGTRNSSSGQP
jgi:hypothetical protein